MDEGVDPYCLVCCPSTAPQLHAWKPLPPEDPIVAERRAAEEAWGDVDFTTDPELKVLRAVAEAAEQVLYGGEPTEVLREAYDVWEARFKKPR